MAGVRRTAARIIIPVAFYPQPFSSKSSQSWQLATRNKSFSAFSLPCPPHGLALPHPTIAEPFWEVFWSPSSE